MRLESREIAPDVIAGISRLAIAKSKDGECDQPFHHHEEGLAHPRRAHCARPSAFRKYFPVVDGIVM
jgi:hypothetical protein